MQPINSEKNYQYILATRAEAQRLLDARPDGDVFTRMSYKGFIEDLDEIIRDWEAKQHNP